jgi:hypothetical protein
MVVNMAVIEHLRIIANEEREDGNICGMIVRRQPSRLERKAIIGLSANASDVAKTHDTSTNMP